MSNDIWQVSTTELMMIFRESLISLIPAMEKAKIPWKDGEAYDDWDNICEVLFKNAVCNNITYKGESEKPFVQYGMTYKSYINNSFIGISVPDYQSPYVVFVEFKTEKDIFDCIRVDLLDNNLNFKGSDVIKLSGIQFAFYLNSKSGIIKKDIIEVEM